MSNDIKFDPMTGEPIEEAAEEAVQETAAAAEEAVEAAPAAAQETVQAAAEAAPAADAVQADATAPKKGKAGKLVAGIVAAAAVVTGGVFGAKSLVGGGSPVDQFRTAVDNTFVADEMTESLSKTGDILEDGKYAIDAAINVQGQDINLTLNTEDGKLSLEGGAKVQGMDIDAALFMDDEKITVDLSKLADVAPLSYDYTTDKSDKSDSYVVKMIGSDTLKQIDGILKMAKSMTGKVDQEKVKDAVYAKMEELEYDELDEKEFTIGGEKVSCAGYETTMTGEFLYDLYNEVYKEAYGKTFDEMMEEIEKLGVADVNTDDLKKQMKEMDEIDMKFYLNDDKFAMIGLAGEADEQEYDVELTFEGKDIPWHTMTLKDVENDQEYKLTTEDKDDTIVYTYEGNGSEGKIEYTKEDGSFEVFTNDQSVAKGTIKTDGDAVVIGVSEVSGQSVNATVTISDDVDVKDAPEGAKDVLELSDQDFSDIANKIVSKFYGM